MLEGVPDVRALLDLLDVGVDAAEARLHRADADLELGQVLLPELVQLV